MDCQSESVRQESNNHALDQDRESSTTTKTESTSSSNESTTDRTKEVVTEIAESAEKVESVGTGEASVDERDGEYKAEREVKGEEEGEGMELEEKGEDGNATGMEIDIQREVEDTNSRTSAGKDKVHCTL